ncbi:hypothetical protein M011DRAFT_490302 [Sporormia fimetaria CBS 119925]|uniref:Uncharacterized protein n=1 Tax=Sporormia fimetaria CBS 119925 TaxID=1340428 RepID=A0A6A6UYD4_9PLEO|nr:hypothetical protein M011DRAFT_490302 [Sporormia fimetaria CBS 119925]
MSASPGDIQGAPIATMDDGSNGRDRESTVRKGRSHQRTDSGAGHRDHDMPEHRMNEHVFSGEGIFDEQDFPTHDNQHQAYADTEMDEDDLDARAAEDNGYDQSYTERSSPVRKSGRLTASMFRTDSRGHLLSEPRKAKKSKAVEDDASPKPGKTKKKPGPKPTRPPPMKKDDASAKKALIREIEGHWGKDFIKNYIPKVHRPLVKRKKNRPRVHNRKHEDDPMKWAPSILKAILSLAEKTDDKPGLKKIMADVVRYRNQHTGNKKPQLVTTDFDVIEDVLERGWNVPQAFTIRYKHLLTNRNGSRTDTKEQDDYYRHLFRESSSSSESGDETPTKEEDQMDFEVDDSHARDYKSESAHEDELRPHNPESLQRYYHDQRGGPRQQPVPHGYNMRAPPHPMDHRQGAQFGGYHQANPYMMDQYGRDQMHPGRMGTRNHGFASSPSMYSYDERYVPHPYEGRHGRGVPEPDRRPRSNYGNNMLGNPRTVSHNRTYRHDHDSSPEVPLANVRGKDSKFFGSSRAPIEIKSEPREEDDAFYADSSRRGAADHRVQTPISVRSQMAMAHDGDADVAEDDEEESIRAQYELAEAEARALKLKVQMLNARNKKK